MVYSNLETANETEELLSAIDICEMIRKLKIQTHDTLDKLKAFSLREGRR